MVGGSLPRLVGVRVDAAGASPSLSVCSASLVIESFFPAVASKSLSAKSMAPTKSVSGRSVMSSLLFLSRHNSGLRKRVSDITILVPGTCSNLMSNSDKNRLHLACLLLSFFAVLKYVKVRWPIVPCHIFRSSILCC